MLYLGIDTGGTFTDAVILDDAFSVLATAKSPTTRHDLAMGISGAVTAALKSAGRAASEIGLVGLSTTLATNAIVEGQGGRIGLVMIGFDASQLDRADLRKALGADPHVLLGGGHTVFGDEARPLDLAALDRFIEETRGRVEAYAVAGMFSVRNADHERRALERITEKTGRPVCASHHLAQALDGPRRALTALLNARLIPIVSDLIRRTETFLQTAGIDAPLMVVRGNGALMSAAEARSRPVETVLSGPAASAVGACFLTGLSHAVISDIGGTTTDVGIIQDGLPKVDPLGATIGGYQTMVEAIRMTTTGLGGDSEIWIDEDAEISRSITLGPRRVIPIAVLAARHAELVHRTLDAQLLRPLPNLWDARFAILARSAAPDGFSPGEREILSALENGPQPLEAIIRNQMMHGTLTRLVARGLVTLAGLTPTDAAHIVGRHIEWDAEASRKAAQLFLRRRNRIGQLHAPSITHLAEHVLELLVRRSADFILESCAEGDGIPPEKLAEHPLVRSALDHRPGLIETRIRLTAPVVGLGASAPLYYPAIAARLGAEAQIPEHAGVANAVGAVVGHVRRHVTVLVSQPELGRYRVHLESSISDHGTYAAARAIAETEARRQALALLAADGAEPSDLRIDAREKIVEIGGEQVLVEAEIIAFATGRPALARHENKRRAVL